MDRRTAITQMFFLAGGLWIAGSCSIGPDDASIILQHLPFKADDEELMAKFVDSMIPKDDSPGARELNVHLFVMKMLDDCYSEEHQKSFIKGFNLAKKELKNADSKQVNQYLSTLKNEDEFLSILKYRTIQGYTKSEYVMKNKLIYELVPGRYNGAMKVS